MTETLSGESLAPSVGENAEDRVRASIRALKSAYDVKTTVLCELLGVGRTQLFAKLNGEARFTISDVAVVAAYFGVDVGSIYAGELTVTPNPTPPARRLGGRRSDGIMRPCYTPYRPHSSPTLGGDLTLRRSGVTRLADYARSEGFVSDLPSAA